MSNRAITWLVFAALVFMVALIFIPRAIVTGGNDLEPTIESIRDSAEQERWTEAKELADKMINQWENQKFWVILNYSIVDISNFESSLRRIKGAAECSDRSIIMAECEVAGNHYKNLVKLLPQP